MNRLLKGHLRDGPSISCGTLDSEWLARLVAVIAVALPASGFAQVDTPFPVNNSPVISEASTAEQEQALPPIQMPATDSSLPLSAAELRWCMSQELWHQAVQPLLGSRNALDRQNERAIDYNNRCGARYYSQAVDEEATSYINEARGEIVAAAIDDVQQLNNRSLTRRIQEMLELLGYKLELHGSYSNYGAQTESEIRSFQLRVGVPADGLVSDSLLGRLQVEYIRIIEGRERERNQN